MNIKEYTILLLILACAALLTANLFALAHVTDLRADHAERVEAWERHAARTCAPMAAVAVDFDTFTYTCAIPRIED